VALDQAPELLLAAYGSFSLVAFAMYRADKRAAQRAEWRIPEVNLKIEVEIGDENELEIELTW
jgi:uncharacterized membrane protein YsdA (DUF1294 family)